MKTVLVHGLGQNSESWFEVKKDLSTKEIVVPDLFSLIKGDAASYSTMFKNFSKYLDALDDDLNLLGLSLGGLLCLDYAKYHQTKVKKMILIGIPYKIPRLLFTLQGLMFRKIKNEVFVELGTDKKSFLALVASMKDIDITKDLDHIDCPVLLACGSKDSANKKSLGKFHQAIKGSKVMIIDGSGHEVNFDRPAELAKIINEFFDIHGPSKK